MIKRLKIYLLHTLMVEAFAYRFLKKYVKNNKYKFELLVELMSAVQKIPKELNCRSVYDQNCLLTNGVSTVFLLEHFRVVDVATAAKTFYNERYGKDAAVRAPFNYSDYPDLVIPEITCSKVYIDCQVPSGTIFLLLPHQVKQTVGQHFKKINKYFYELQINDTSTPVLANGHGGDSSGTGYL